MAEKFHKTTSPVHISLQIVVGKQKHDSQTRKDTISKEWENDMNNS